LTFAVIAVNALYIGIDAGWNNESMLYDSHPAYILLDHLFCSFFVFEWGVRFFALQSKSKGFQDKLFRLDTFLVTVMVLETWIIGTLFLVLGIGAVAFPMSAFVGLRLLRLTRLTRLSWLMTSMPQLMVLAKGMYEALKAVLTSLIMVVFLIYIFGIALYKLVGHEAHVNKNLGQHLFRDFSSLSNTFWLLWIDGTFAGEPGRVMTVLWYSDDLQCTIACAAFFTFLSISNLLILNMLIGILCDIVTSITRAEKDDTALRFMKDSLMHLVQATDDGDGQISKAEAEQIMTHRDAKEVYQQMNIDPLFLTELLQTLYKKGNSHCSIKEMIDLMLLCRGSEPTTVSHLASGQAFLSSRIDTLKMELVELFHTLKSSRDADHERA
jgi:hypothetical protein